jgi:hypothetical protein
MLTMGVCVGRGNRSEAGIVVSTLHTCTDLFNDLLY